MFAISLNYKKATASFRQNLAFTQGEMAAFLISLKDAGLEECLYVSTCNRCEVYGVGNSRTALNILAEYGELEQHELTERALFYEGEGAVSHLFRVIAGLESMVLGEDEILGQMKEAYGFAKELDCTGYELNTIFQAAIRCAKKIKTETALSKTSVSIASLAATKCHHFMEGEKRVMILGATGDTGNKVMLNLLSYGDCKIFATKYHHHLDHPKVTVIPFEKRYEYINAMDVVISATKSPHYTVTYGKLNALPMHPKKRLFLDLAVPKDLDEDIVKIPNTTLLTIDDFQKIAKENNEKKQMEAHNGELLIEEEMDSLLKELQFHSFRREFQHMFQRKNKNMDLERFVYQYKDYATAEEFASFLHVLQQMK